MTSSPAPLDRAADLRDLRSLLWDSIREAPADKRAPLAKQLADVLRELEQLNPAKAKGDPIDELNRRRAARGAGSAATKRRATAD